MMNLKDQQVELVERAWRDANGDALTAVKLVRERRPELGLRGAARLVADIKHIDFVDRTGGESK